MSVACMHDPFGHWLPPTFAGLESGELYQLWRGQCLNQITWMFVTLCICTCRVCQELYILLVQFGIKRLQLLVLQLDELEGCCKNDHAIFMSTYIFISHSRADQSNGEDSCKSQASYEVWQVHVWICLCVQLVMLLMLSFQTGHLLMFFLNLIYLKLESLCAAGRRKRGNRFPKLRNWKWWSGVPASVKFQLCNFQNILSFCEEIADSSLEAANGCGPREGENGYIFGESSALPGQDQAQWEIHVRKAGTWHVYVFNIQLFISTWCRNEAWSDSSTTSKVKFLP